MNEPESIAYFTTLLNQIAAAARANAVVIVICPVDKPAAAEIYHTCEPTHRDQVAKLIHAAADHMSDVDASHIAMKIRRQDLN